MSIGCAATTSRAWPPRPCKPATSSRAGCSFTLTEPSQVRLSGRGPAIPLQSLDDVELHLALNLDRLFHVAHGERVGEEGQLPVQREVREVEHERDLRMLQDFLLSTVELLGDLAITTVHKVPNVVPQARRARKVVLGGSA